MYSTGDVLTPICVKAFAAPLILLRAACFDSQKIIEKIILDQVYPESKFFVSLFSLHIFRRFNLLSFLPRTLRLLSVLLPHVPSISISKSTPLIVVMLRLAEISAWAGTAAHRSAASAST